MANLTFVTVGKLAGKTVDLGQDGKYKFVDGEMSCPEEIFGMVSTALRFYSAFPKGDAMPFHIAACTKLGLDPNAVPLGKPVPTPVQAAPLVIAKKTVADAAAASAAAKRRTKEALAAFVDTMDPDDDTQWTQQGKASLDWVRKNFDAEDNTFLNRETLNATGITRALEET